MPHKKPLLPRKPTRDDRTIADCVMDWMAENCPAWSIDQLLCAPHTAIEMCQSVLDELGRKYDEAAVNEVCRVALNQRKRGKLKIGRKAG